MKVYLKKSMEGFGLMGEMVTVDDGYARNFLIPKGIAVEVTPNNEASFLKRARTVENRKEVIETKTSIMADKIKTLKLVLKRKMHDNGQLYGAIRSNEVVDLLKELDISVSKSQIKFDKSIKSKGSFVITIELTSRIKTQLTLDIVPE